MARSPVRKRIIGMRVRESAVTTSSPRSPSAAGSSVWGSSTSSTAISGISHNPSWSMVSAATMPSSLVP